ncbi:DUF1292 domain-containing protein [Neobacillus mesonae]|nr:DUF1292 domain-containing protein [Neobacillus mesonae]
MTEFPFSRADLVVTTRLREAFGSEVELEDENGKSIPYELLAEFEVFGQGYAVLQAVKSKYDEYELLRVEYNGEDGKPELLTIEDDEEWENIAELYDEWSLPDDEG